MNDIRSDFHRTNEPIKEQKLNQEKSKLGNQRVQLSQRDKVWVQKWKFFFIIILFSLSFSLCQPLYHFLHLTLLGYT